MRETRIDLIRGLAMLTIAVNHMSYLLSQLGHNGPSFPTLTSFGFSSSAEIFFLMSGYMVGMVYLPKTGLGQKSISRATKIYICNVAAFALVCLVSSISPNALSAATDLDYFWGDPVKATIMFLALLQHPYLAGVLQVYVVLMLLTPMAAVLCKKNIIPFLVLSTSLYTAVQLFPMLNLPGGAPKDDLVWNFNPFAWQLLYCLGIALGYRKTHIAVFAWIDKSTANLLIPVVSFVALAPVFLLHSQEVYTFPMTDKTNLGFLRVLHVFVAIGTMVSVATMISRFLPRVVGYQVEVVGRNTLECYAASIVFTYIFGAVWLLAGLHGMASYLAIMCLILAATLATAHVKASLFSATKKTSLAS